MKRIFLYIAIAVVTIAFIVLAVKTQMILRVDPATGLEYDGLGREIFPAPYLLRRVGMVNWAGLFWFIVDSIVGWTLIGIDYLLFRSLKKSNHSKNSNQSV